MKTTLYIVAACCLGAICLTSCQLLTAAKVRSINSLVSVGDDIYEARGKLHVAGYRTSKVADITQTSKALSFVVTLRDPNAIESFGYAAQLDPPWPKQPFASVVVTANYSTRKIYKIETR